MTVDWSLDLAIRAAGGLLLITCACLLFSLLKQRVSEFFGTVQEHVTGNSGASVTANEASKMKEAVGRAADQSRAVEAAQHVIAIATNRNNVSTEHLLFYDFVTAAARATIADASFAESVGRDMPR